MVSLIKVKDKENGQNVQKLKLFKELFTTNGFNFQREELHKSPHRIMCTILQIPSVNWKETQKPSKKKEKAEELRTSNYQKKKKLNPTNH
jgi:GTP cyclohydrolase I